MIAAKIVRLRSLSIRPTSRGWPGQSSRRRYEKTDRPYLKYPARTNAPPKAQKDSRMVPAVPMTGKRFGQITVMGRADPASDAKGIALWYCRCDCGETFVRPGPDIRQRGAENRCRSCGISIIIAKQTIHGKSDTHLHVTWLGIKRRCRNAEYRGYKSWGGRGIRIIDRWHDDFEQFEADILTEIGDRPTAGHTLDRRDNMGHYEPGNIRWATVSEQNRNRRPYAKRASRS